MKRVLVLVVFLSSNLFLWAQEDSVLTIGVKETHPFVYFHEKVEPTGLSIDFWNMMADEIPARTRFRKFDDVPGLLEALRQGEIDLSINPITVNDQRMKFLDFSQPFYISGTSMVRRQENQWLAVLSNIFSYRFLSAAAVLLAVIFFFGFLVWLFERRKNTEEFKPGVKGLGDGFWWSAVTMTTVGYGDKSPRTKGGRVVGFIWMFAAIILISGLTAGIASALTVTQLESSIESVEDLRNFKSATLEGSSTEHYLQSYGVQARTFDDIEEGLRAVENGEVEVFVYDRPILQYHLSKMEDLDLRLSSHDLKTDYYSFSFPKGSPLLQNLNPEVVKVLKSETWDRRLRSLDL